MKSLYLYSIQKTKDLPALGKARGVDFAWKLSAIPLKSISIVVGIIDSPLFETNSLKKRMKEDLQWAQENINKHHRVIKFLSKSGPLIPMRFGVVFKSKSGLLSSVKKGYKNYLLLLDWLNHKEEWDLRIYLQQENLYRSLAKKYKELKKTENQIKDPPEKLKLYLTKERAEKNYLAEKIFSILSQSENITKKYCEKIIIAGSHPHENGNRRKEMVINASCLIEKNRFPDFLQATKKMRERVGLDVTLTGPWPPYTFANFDNLKEK